MKAPQCPKGGKDWAQERLEGVPVPKTKQDWALRGDKEAIRPNSLGI